MDGGQVPVSTRATEEGLILSNQTQQRGNDPIYKSTVVGTITSRASKLIKGSGEKNQQIRRLAQAVVNQFYHIIDPNLRMSLSERTQIARDMAAEQLPELFKGITPKEIDAGMTMGTKALTLSSKIEQHESSFTKASLIMRREVNSRQKEEANATRTSAYPRRSRTDHKVDKPSQKPGYKNSRKAQRHKIAA